MVLHGIAFVFFHWSITIKVWWLKVHGEGSGWKVGARGVPFLFTWLAWRVKVPWFFTMDSKLQRAALIEEPDEKLLLEVTGLTVEAKKVNLSTNIRS